MEVLSEAKPSLPEPYEAPDLFDQVFESFAFDLDFWRGAVREIGGPVLEVGCGTGRVLLDLAKDGVDVDGVDLFPAMLERLERKAKALGLAPRVVAGDMRDFRMPRRYRTVLCAFNTFAHNLTSEDQLATLKCIREHLEPGGAFVLHLSVPPPSFWIAPDGEPVLELETQDPATGNTLRVYDTRHKDWVREAQHSLVEIQELSAAGAPLRSHRFETRQRWVSPNELELLLRLAGFARWTLYGGFDRRPMGSDLDQMIAFAWRDA
jgi:SAM-dependent methyltransferase